MFGATSTTPNSIRVSNVTTGASVGLTYLSTVKSTMNNRKMAPKVINNSSIIDETFTKGIEQE